MYQKHQPLIQSWVEEDPQHLFRVILFALLSIRQPFNQIADQIKDVDKRGNDSPHLWSFKRDAYNHISSPRNLDTLISSTLGDFPPEEKLFAISKIPGIGYPKAGFILQMSRGEIGCLDSQNIAEYGLNYNYFRCRKEVGSFSRMAAASRYVHLCNDLGGPQVLWDNWCNTLFKKNQPFWQSSHRVSFYHLTCLGVSR